MGVIRECFYTPLFRYKRTFVIDIYKTITYEHNSIYRHQPSRPDNGT